MADAETTSNQIIDTNQPRVLKGYTVRGVKMIPTIHTVKKGAGPDGEDVYMCVNEEDYDKEQHGSKVDKLPVKKKAAKKKEEKKKDKE